MRRVPEVLDCWFESGSMPFAQVHYPFENADWFEHHYPGDFIVEYNGQTRGWFYTLHVLATALFDRPAFRSCVAHGIVLGDDGAKMSKSRKNYPDVNEVFERDGSDAMRWFLMASPILRGGNLVVTEQGIREGVRQAVLPLWNTWYFLSLYANAAGRVGAVAHRLDARARPVRAGEDRGAGRRGHRGAGRARHRRGVRAGARPRRGADQLVRPPLARAVLGRRRRRDRHPAHRAGGDRPGRRAAAAADHGAGVAGADRRAVGAPDGLAGRRTSCRTTTRWSRRWTGCGRWRRRRCRCARPAACGCGCRWPGSRWPRRTRRRWSRSPTSCATR